MQPTKRLLTIVTPFLAFILFCGTSFKAPDKTTDTTTVKKPCEATCQFSPTAGNFATCNFWNCNGAQGTLSVAAGTSWIPMLVGTGCTIVGIDVNLPTFHPAGTVEIMRAGVIVFSQNVAANEAFSFSRKIAYDCDDYYIVSFY